jgi:hypothetical protein
MTLDRMREEHIKALIGQRAAQLSRERDIDDMFSRRGRLLQGPPEKPLPDVPLHKRGFGVMDEDQLP